MSDQLNPCQFCGQEPHVVYRPLMSGGSCWHVTCENDDCEKKPGTWFYYDMKDAIDEWNESVSPITIDDVGIEVR